MPYHDKFLIGLTGNIACGKSTVLARLGKLGAHTIDADKAIHAILRKSGPAYDPVVREFGTGILDDKGEIDRRELGRIVFSDPAKLRRLEEIEHPIVRRALDEEIRSAPQPVVVLDAIKLFESGWADKCDVVWVVTCRRGQQISRLMRTRGYSRQEAVMRVDAQGPQADKVARAGLVIDNAGTIKETVAQVDHAWDALFAGDTPAPPAGALRRDRSSPGETQPH